MTDQSSYLRYLPPVLQPVDYEKDKFSLGGFLRVFERILTGVEDVERVSHHPAGTAEAHDHAPLEQVIGELHRLFDPWSIREGSLLWPTSWADALRWLASCVALDLPTLQGEPLWDEYQQRRAVAEIAAVYKQRGLKAGLKRSLYLHTLGQGRPRIAIDDGSRVLFCQPEPGRYAPVHAQISWGGGAVERDGGDPSKTYISAEGLFRPWSLVFGANGDLTVSDLGLVDAHIKPCLWRLTTNGENTITLIDEVKDPVTGLPKLGKNLDLPIGICTDPVGGSLYVLNRNNKSADLYEIKPNKNELELMTLPSDPFVYPVAIEARQVDVGGNMHLFILDRGKPNSTDRAEPMIVDVELTTPNPTITVNPVTALDPVTGIVEPLGEPLSLAILNDVYFIIGQGGLDNSGSLPGNLVRVAKSNWQGERILGNDEKSNPLVAPMALVRVDDTQIYVLDAGLRPVLPRGEVGSFVSNMAHDAAVYKVNINLDKPKPQMSIARVSEVGQLVYPTGMAMNAGTLFITDPGIVKTGDETLALWRARHHEFAVIVHFLAEALPSDKTEQDMFLKRVSGDIRGIIKREKPAHTIFDVFTEVR